MITKVTWHWVDYDGIGCDNTVPLYTTTTGIVFNDTPYEVFVLGLTYEATDRLWSPCHEYTDDNIQYYFNMMVLNMVNGFLNTGEY